MKVEHWWGETEYVEEPYIDWEGAKEKHAEGNQLNIQASELEEELIKEKFEFIK